MGICYDKMLRPIMFRMDPEKAHELAVNSLAILSSMRLVCRLMASGKRRGCTPVELFGLRFPNIVGLAAGFDKNARVWPAAAALGFGHVEVGTITAHRQPGNPRPRAFRYAGEEAIVNRMGFNNDGAEKVARRLSRQFKRGKPSIPLGINIGKSKVVSLEHAADDYLRSFEALADYADYFCINVSSPNTPDLRRLQEESLLVNLLRELKDANEARAVQAGRARIPMLVKIAPDLTFRQIDAVLATVLDLEYDGIVATNTTLGRPEGWRHPKEEGGLSGRPLQALSTRIIRYISQRTGGRLPIIGVGGIHDAESVGEKIDAGASLVQIYTGLVYHGPAFPVEVARAARGRGQLWF